MSTLLDLSDDEILALDVPGLEAAIRHHNQLYWDQAEPEISDVSYDRLVERLRALAPDSPVLEDLGPEAALDPGQAVLHAVPMLSLDKCYAFSEADSRKQSLRTWAFVVDRGFERGPRFAGEVVVTPKMDGIACSLRYGADGALELAATRGDGRRGENITRNALTIDDIPRTIGAGPLEVRGEIYMRLSVFDEYADRFQNPRNLAAGAIKQKDPAACRAYRLSFYAYDLFGTAHTVETDKLAELGRLGFAPIEHRLLPPERLMEGVETFTARRSSLDFEIDGVVFKVNRVDEQERLGLTAHHPRYAIAFKFQGEQAETTLLKVEWSVARSGAITPVARVEPVTLSGASVSRASLHNAGFLRKLGLHGRYPGARVLITRRGGVIPKVELVVRQAEAPSPDDQPILPPETCPSCGGPVRWDPPGRGEPVDATVKSEELLYCVNPSECRMSSIGLIRNYLKVLDIDGFGEKLLVQLYDAGLLRTPADLYDLTLEDLVGLERVGPVLAKKLLAELDSHRVLPLPVFLKALGIPDLSNQISGILAEQYKTLDNIRSLQFSDLIQVRESPVRGRSSGRTLPVHRGLGEKTARKVLDGLAQRAAQIDRLLQQVSIEEQGQAGGRLAGTGPLSGQSFVFTGKLLSMTRTEAQRRVLDLGGDTPSGVSRELSYLVIGDGAEDKPSSKQQKAEALLAAGAPLRIIREHEFIDMIEKANSQIKKNIQLKLDL